MKAPIQRNIRLKIYEADTKPLFKYCERWTKFHKN